MNKEQKSWYSMGFKLGKMSLGSEGIAKYMYKRIQGIGYKNPVKDVEELMVYMKNFDIPSEPLFDVCFKGNEEECGTVRNYIYMAYQSGRYGDEKNNNVM